MITAAGQHSKSDYNLYEGTEVTGDVDTVLVRGTVVVGRRRAPGRAGLRAVRRAGARSARGSLRVRLDPVARGRTPHRAPDGSRLYGSSRTTDE